jgi:hypothetical protein
MISMRLYVHVVLALIFFLILAQTRDLVSLIRTTRKARYSTTPMTPSTLA